MLRKSDFSGTQTATFAGAPQSSAVPSAGKKSTTTIDKEYEAFKNCFELDVTFTIGKDLEDENEDEKVREVQSQSQYELHIQA